MMRSGASQACLDAVMLTAIAERDWRACAALRRRRLPRNRTPHRDLPGARPKTSQRSNERGRGVDSNSRALADLAHCTRNARASRFRGSREHAVRRRPALLHDDPSRRERRRVGDTIRIAPGTFAGGVTIDRSVNVIGVGASVTRIYGGGPVLTIGSGSTTPTVALSDLTIAGGDTSSDPQAPRCGPDLTTCGPGYPGVTAVGSRRSPGPT